MKRILLAVLLLSSLGLEADWTIKLPEPDGNKLPWLTLGAQLGGEFGTVLVMQYTSGGPPYRQRCLWVSPSGAALVDREWSTAVFEAGSSGSKIRLLSENRLMIWGTDQRPESPTYQGPILDLLTIDAAGGIIEQQYAFAPTVWPGLPEGRIPTDPSGITVLDTKAWTLSRIDFPTLPASTAGGQATVRLQSSTNAIGPWSIFKEIDVPTTAPVEFFRLELKPR